MITIEDIRKPSNISGFRYVSISGLHRGGTGTPHYQGDVVRGNSRTGNLRRLWRGPRRLTAEEAAQDYCDYVNSGRAPQPVNLRTANHAHRPSPERDEETEAALSVLRDKRALRQGQQGFIYLLGESEGRFAVKVGFSTMPKARLGEMQTGNPRPLELIASKPGTEQDEKELHTKYHHDNVLGECFRPSTELLAEFT